MTREWKSGEIRDLGDWLWGATTPDTSVVRIGEKWGLIFHDEPVVSSETNRPIEWLSRDGAIAHGVRLLRGDGRAQST